MADEYGIDVGAALGNAFKLHSLKQGVDTQNAFAQALPMLQSDPQNALAKVGATGNIDAYSKISNLVQQADDHHKAVLSERAEAQAKVALDLQKYKDPIIRKAVLQSQRDFLKSHKFTDQEIDSYDPTDQNLNTSISNARTVTEAIAQQNTDRQFAAGRSDHADTVANEKANRAVTIRGQNMTDARAKESNTILSNGDPVVQSWVSNVANGNATMQQVPARYKNSVSMALKEAPTAVYSPLASSRMTLASSRITAPFTNMAAYKLTADGLPYLQRIDAALKHPGSVSDQDLLDSLTKLNTGGNAVTDAQVKLITDGKSFSDTIGTWGNKVQNGGVLSDNQRQQIKKIANDIFANYRKGYQPVYEQASGQLKAAGIPEQFWTIPDLNKLNAGQADILAEKPPAAASTPSGQIAHVASDADYAKLASGTVFVGPDGHQRRKP